jgi:hypothetical protein
VASVNPLLRRAETRTEFVQHWRSSNRLIMVHGKMSPAPDMKKIILVMGCVAVQAAVVRPAEPQPPRPAVRAAARAAVRLAVTIWVVVRAAAQAAVRLAVTIWEVVRAAVRVAVVPDVLWTLTVILIATKIVRLTAFVSLSALPSS